MLQRFSLLNGHRVGCGDSAHETFSSSSQSHLAPIPLEYIVYLARRRLWSISLYFICSWHMAKEEQWNKLCTVYKKDGCYQHDITHWFPYREITVLYKKIHSRVIFLHVIANCFKVVQIFFYYNIRDLPPPIKVYKCVMLMPSCPSAYMIILN